MNAKAMLILIMSLLLSGLLHAQDILILINNQRAKVKIIEVGDTEIKYLLYSNLDGPIQNIKREKVDKIVYENGDTKIIYEDLSIRVPLFGMKYYKGSSRIKKDEFMLVLQENEAAYNSFRRGKSLINASNIVGIPSSLVFGWNVGTWAAGGDISRPITLISGILTGGSIIVGYSGLAKTRRALDTFNNSKSIGLNLKLDHNGIGLVFSFN